MMRRGFRLLSLFVLVAALGGLLPLGAAAQFPSQGGDQSSPGGFPSQGPAGRGGFYQSQEFGFSLSWGPEWSLVFEAQEPGLDYVSLSNGVSEVTVGVITNPVSPQDFVIEVANILGEGQWTFGEVIDDDPTRAGAIFSDPGGIDHYVDAIELGEGAKQVVVFSFPADQAQTESAAFLALMEGFQPPASQTGRG
jgi:hypothetical protein